MVKRMLLRDSISGGLYRVVHVETFAPDVWLCEINDDSWPKPFYKSNCSERFSVELDDPFHRPHIQSHRDKSADLRHQHCWELIEPLVSGENARLIIYPQYRKTLIAQRLCEVETTRQSLSTQLKRFFKRGMNYEALRTDYSNCGGRGKKRNVVGVKLGRPRTISPGVGVSVNESVRRHLRIAADYYLSPRKPTLQDAIDRITGFFYSDIVKDGHGRPCEVNSYDAKPTVRQLRYFLEQAYPEKHIRIRREGVKHYDLHERELLGKADGDVQGPGDLFLVDATVADVYLRSQEHRRRIVGRPIIYFVVDVFSRMIVGIYVGFEGPSWIGAMMALTRLIHRGPENCMADVA